MRRTCVTSIALKPIIRIRLAAIREQMEYGSRAMLKKPVIHRHETADTCGILYLRVKQSINYVCECAR